MAISCMKKHNGMASAAFCTRYSSRWQFWCTHNALSTPLMPHAHARFVAHSPIRSLGQNFLTDEAILKSIVAAAGVTAADVVLEVGPGTGNLTRCLVATGAQVGRFARAMRPRAVTLRNIAEGSHRFSADGPCDLRLG
jgi:hypothetical protein